MRFFHVFDLIKCHFGVTLSERNIAIRGELYIYGVRKGSFLRIRMIEKQTKTTIKNRIIRDAGAVLRQAQGVRKPGALTGKHERAATLLGRKRAGVIRAAKVYAALVRRVYLPSGYKQGTKLWK